jgi:hypothetical protein
MEGGSGLLLLVRRAIETPTNEAAHFDRYAEVYSQSRFVIIWQIFWQTALGGGPEEAFCLVGVTGSNLWPLPCETRGATSECAAA